ncbi:TPA: hypothetical protein ACSVPQ_002488 [Clostridioides difficile]|uniref:Uncharacterized protein n=1 Tax=Clostridioides difficile TaxID=1496 RepID=A0AAN5VTJ9_CLODI|nr:hypothetical protein [Clostridioides difficile]EGT3945758.1 hypothetical protein [Clostridioides difficile]MBY1346193.1 hypothetical protein [Clostridioides difficile]MCA0574623.1 hypothetical protein [Clostridioides difficile]MCM0739730.1 hypothetical protein [Clostridioides difficile]MCW0772763.1 hypothetical protein [Clostridioides difficile]
MSKNIYEIMNEIKSLRTDFINRKSSLSKELGVLSKRINQIEKMIEFNKDKLNNERKAELIDELYILFVKKRKVKREFNVAIRVDEDNKFSYNMLGFTLKGYDDLLEKLKMVEKNRLMDISQYGVYEIDVANYTHEDIENKIKYLKPKYDMVFYSEDELVIYYYNRCVPI